MRSDVERWNARYQSRAASGDIDPDPLLTLHRDLLGGDGLCLDLAGGAGDNGLYLAQLGCRSLIVDASEAGLRLCRHKARANGLEPMLVVADLDRFTLPRGTFDAVLVFRYLNRALIDPIRESLKTNGTLFFKTFNPRHLEDHPRFREDYVLKEGELADWFSGMQCIDSNDGDPSTTTWHWVGSR